MPSPARYFQNDSSLRVRREPDYNLATAVVNAPLLFHLTFINYVTLYNQHIDFIYYL